MTNNEAIEWLISMYNIANQINDCLEYKETLDIAIKALEKQPCEDCISRKAVETAFYDLGLGDEENGLADYMWGLWDAYEAIKSLPSVTPQPKILEEIREEIVSHIGGNGAVNDGIDIALEVIDKYMEEEE